MTVLGSAASCPGPGQACAGYFVEAAGARVLLDCGHGVLANLGKVEDPLSLDAVFISHHHPDHFADLYALQAMIRYAPEGPLEPLPLYLPEGLAEQLKGLLSERGAEEFDEAFVTLPLRAGETTTLGDFSVTPFAVEHSGPTLAFVVEADGVRVCYTADTSVSDGVRAAAAGADLLLAEATLPEAYAGAAPHLTAREAGEIARAAGAGALVLTHVWYTSDRAVLRREAEEAFGGPVGVASEFDTYEITCGAGGDD